MIETLPGGVVLIGTAHVSPTSVEQVEKIIREQRPDRVLVELDHARLTALRDPDAWKNTDILQILREKKQHLFLIQLYLAAMQAKVGRETGISPGAELLRAVQAAEEVGAEVVLIDRDVAITMKRGFGSMGFWARLKLFWHLWMHLLTPADQPVDAKQEVERLLHTDAITEMTEEFARVAPAIKTALIDERDAFMASHIVEHAGKGPVVAVVGAGHVEGIKRLLREPHAIPDRAGLLHPPPRRFPWGTVIGLLVPIGIAVWIGYLLMGGRQEDVWEFFGIWVVTHVVLAGLGGFLARGHPLAVLSGALISPITDLLPIGIKSGWVAGFVQAKMRMPKVRDFEQIKHLDTFGEFWNNGIVKILTVTSLVILGSEVAGWVAIFWAAKGGI